jgi:hypothetical protein
VPSAEARGCSTVVSAAVGAASRILCGVVHFREARDGRFYLDEHPRGYRGDETAVVRFMAARGFADPDWKKPSELLPPDEVLRRGRLWWLVEEAEIETVESLVYSSQRVPRYRALVHPPTGQVMDVVQTSYHVAQNMWVATTALTLARGFSRDATLVGAASFGRNDQKTVFAVRVSGDEARTLLLVALNTHGGEGAVRFTLQYVTHAGGTVLVPVPDQAVRTVPHRDRVEERLDQLAGHGLVADYVKASDEALRKLSDALWSPRHTTAVINAFWPLRPPRPKRAEPRPELLFDEDAPPPRHPGSYLTTKLAGCTDAASAYEMLCHYLDTQSNACRAGDFTPDRDERLVSGAVWEIKNRVWDWVVANT